MIAWLGNFFLIVYYWRIAKKHRDALLFAAGGQIAYTAWGLMASPKLWAVVFLDLLCLALTTRAWVKWGQGK